MKKTILTVVLALLCTASFACTNLIIGKKASVDGSVFCTYNCDGFGFAASLSYSPAGAHAPGERLAFPVRGENGEVSYRYIPQVAYTYGVVGLMNDHQVSIVETTWDGRTELVDRNGLFDYFTLMDITLQRSATAREAIKVIDELVQTYGYNSTGESFAICDKEEAWIFEIIGKGPDNTGAVWVARRVPDDCISAYANCSRIRQFPQSKKIDKNLGFYVSDGGNTMYSAECISFAREKGYFTSKNDADFSFREAYGPIDFSSVRYCDARVWSFFRHHYDKDVMDSYLPYLNGQFDVCDELPLWIKPDAPLSERDVMNDMRDHYEGTALDMTVDVSAGPWASPYRNQPVNFYASDSTAMFRERPIGCQQSGMTMVCRMRSWMPDATGITYFNMDDATMVAYVPVYCGITRTPEPFRRENNNIREFSTESAFWMNNWVANMIYPRWSAMIGDLRDAQKELEDFYQADQKEVEARVAQMEAADIVTFLTQKTESYTDMMMKRWDKLAKLLIVKHNDQIMQPSENGELVAGRRTSPAYSPVFIDAVKAQTGSRYVKPDIK